MRKLHQMEIPDPLVSEGEYIEYTAENGRVFHVLAVETDKPGYCPGCTFYKFKYNESCSRHNYYVCECGPKHNTNLCYKGFDDESGKSFCKFIDIDAILEDL